MSPEEIAKVLGTGIAPPAHPHLKRFGDRWFERQPDGSWKPAPEEREPTPFI